MRSLDLELLARIITNSPAMQGPLQPSQQSSQQQSRPTTNNFIININQSPGGGGTTTSSFFPNPNIITQQPTTTSFVDSFPSNSSFQLMQSPAANSLSSPYQQQQQENTEMQTGEMLQLSHRLSLHPYIESPALSSSAATSDVASEVGGGGGGTENASSIASTAHPATSVTSLENLRQQMQMHMQMQQQHQQQIQSESVNAAALPDSTVRFYGPYRAYYEPPS
ncbi:hypothetical protein TYRP_016817, partial [Tyrophagus putrescentiae]